MGIKLIKYFSYITLIAAAIISPLSTYADDEVFVDNSQYEDLYTVDTDYYIYEEWLDVTMGYTYYLNDQNKYGNPDNLDTGYAFFLNDCLEYQEKF